MNVVMYGNYIKWMQIMNRCIINLCNYLIYQCDFFVFFLNNVRSYNPRSHLPFMILRKISILIYLFVPIILHEMFKIYHLYNDWKCNAHSEAHQVFYFILNNTK